LVTPFLPQPMVEGLSRLALRCAERDESKAPFLSFFVQEKLCKSLLEWQNRTVR
jgi:hypothetical protein